MRRCEIYLQKNGERQLHTQRHLRDDKTVKGVADEENDKQRHAIRQHNTHYRVGVAHVIGFVEQACEDASCGHSARYRARNAGQQQRQGKDSTCISAQKRLEKLFGLPQIVDCRMMLKEGGSGQKYHGAVNSPPHNHGEKGIEKLVTEGLFHRSLALLIDLTALDYLRMQKQIVRHDHSSQYAHNNEHAAMGHRRHHPRTRSLKPVDVDKEQFVDERQADDAHKTYDCTLHTPVSIGKQQQRHHHNRYQRAPHKGYTEEHLQRNGRT